MSALGRLLSMPTIERGVERCLRTFLGFYLGEVLAQAGEPRDGLPDPNDLVRVSELGWPTASNLTLAIVATPGTTGDAKAEPESYTATWEVVVGVLADLGDRLDTREAAQFYAAAAGMAVAHQGVAKLDGDGEWVTDESGLVVLEGSSVLWRGERTRQLAGAGERALIAGEARVTVTVEGARSRYAPDDLLPPDPDDPRPEVPEGDPSPVVPSLTIARDDDLER